MTGNYAYQYVDEAPVESYSKWNDSKRDARNQVRREQRLLLRSQLTSNEQEQLDQAESIMRTASQIARDLRAIANIRQRMPFHQEQLRLALETFAK